MYKKTLTKILCAGTILITNATASYQDIENENSFMTGFITAFKAAQADSKIQGLEESPIDLKRYIVYYDASNKDLAQWDKLMVQMLGYTRSIHSPLRTKNNWIIFTSSNSYGTAIQEMQLLNKDIFSKQQTKLELFDNKENKVFKKAKALLAEDIQEFQEQIKKESDTKLQAELTKKKKELEENQQVAVIYVDKEIGTIAKPTTHIQEKKSKEKVKESKTPKKQKEAQKTLTVEEPFKPTGKIKIKDNNTVIYKLTENKTFVNKKTFPVSNFEIAGVVQKDDKTYLVGGIAEDNDGTTYFKLHKKNLFVDTKNVKVLK